MDRLDADEKGVATVYPLPSLDDDERVPTVRAPFGGPQRNRPRRRSRARGRVLRGFRRLGDGEEARSGPAVRAQRQRTAIMGEMTCRGPSPCGSGPPGRACRSPRAPFRSRPCPENRRRFRSPLAPNRQQAQARILGRQAAHVAGEIGRTGREALRLTPRPACPSASEGRRFARWPGVVARARGQLRRQIRPVGPLLAGGALG
jgi:hypothetical protein